MCKSILGHLPVRVGKNAAKILRLYLNTSSWTQSLTHTFCPGFNIATLRCQPRKCLWLKSLLHVTKWYRFYPSQKTLSLLKGCHKQWLTSAWNPIPGQLNGRMFKCFQLLTGRIIVIKFCRKTTYFFHYVGQSNTWWQHYRHGNRQMTRGH